MSITPVRIVKIVLFVGLTAVAAVGMVALIGGAPTSHPVVVAKLGTPSSAGAMERVIDTPGSVVLETVVGADWQASRGGLIDLGDPNSESAGLVEGPEPIQIFFHALRHPTQGLFMVDTGVEHALAVDPAQSAVGPLVLKVVAPVQVRNETGAWLTQQQQPLVGVFFTHLHIDHIMGVPDIDPAAALYSGPEVTPKRAVANFLTTPILDREFARKGPIQQWAFQADPDKRFAGVMDIFGDQSVWAIWAPGHTPGSTAYVVRTPQGPVLLTGDTCHTRWGWDHHVPPGKFSDNAEQAAESFRRLQDLAARHPGMNVRLGHQL